MQREEVSAALRKAGGLLQSCSVSGTNVVERRRAGSLTSCCAMIY